MTITAELTGRGITAPPLTAHRDPWELRLLADDRLLADLALAVGGPFHVLFPERVTANLRAYRAAFAEAGLAGAIYYARKANKAACVITACARADAGVDVSSPGELVAALGGGIRGRELMITGPAKSDELLWLATRHGAMIAIDAVDELDRLIALRAEPCRVLLRVRPRDSASRFGMTEAELVAALDLITRAGPDSIMVDGFSFHLTGYDPAPRARLAGELVDRCLRLRSEGHPASMISIGGGFAVDYADAEQWRAFADGLRDRWCHDGQGSGSLYPYHSEVAGPAMLTEILRTDGLADRLREHGIRLAIEPGRSLLDRAGLSVFAVRGVKIREERGLPYRMITVDGSSLSLSEQWFGSEYVPDPVLWPSGTEQLQSGAAAPVPTCVGGVTCLESDLLSRRRIPLPREPRIGDLLIYPNTAGYQMDSNESEFQNHPIPPKIVLRPDLRWSLDHARGERS
ncbi:Y4yA family PLP-dependent enzyme [Microlunatus speluncae]|uniref:Y4yA family PLP-dependent enzyme n=1 Tax=Microlunatus speluncae TaxID=2594267 RepID=UPI00126688CB|nr:Y4yA family PLP-dependent enzyme [Microlunatus speluncae]